MDKPEICALSTVQSVNRTGMAGVGTLAWHRTVWETEIKPMFEPKLDKEVDQCII